MSLSTQNNNKPDNQKTLKKRSKHVFQIHILFASAFISCLDFRDQDAMRLLMLLTDLMKDN